MAWQRERWVRCARWQVAGAEAGNFARGFLLRFLGLRDFRVGDEATVKAAIPEDWP